MKIQNRQVANLGARVDFHDYFCKITPQEKKILTSKLSKFGSNNYCYCITTKSPKKGIALLEIKYKCENQKELKMGDIIIRGKDLKIGDTIKIRTGKNVTSFFRNLTNTAGSYFDFLSKQKHLY